MTIDFLSDIGNPVKLDKRTDPSDQANDRFRRGMSVVDLIPVNYNLNLAKFADSAKKKEWIVSYEFDEAIGDFQKACESYGIEDSKTLGGLRLWLTGDTISQEEISNNFGDNAIQSKLNTITEMGQKAQEALKSFGGQGKAVGTAATESFADLVSTGASMLSPELAVSAGAIAKITGKLMAEGKHFSLPKVWKDSTYNPSLALNVKLISPYGDQESVKRHVLIPLVQLLILASPSSDDGLTYGHPKYLKVKAYGITDINIGVISSISINRGGADTTYNIWRQPTSLDLTININPALNGFASAWSHVDEDFVDIANVDTIDDPDDYALEKLGPGITTIGNVINSFKPVPVDIQAPVGMSDKDAQDLANVQSSGIRDLIKGARTIASDKAKKIATGIDAKAKDFEKGIQAAADKKRKEKEAAEQEAADAATGTPVTN
jgi:plasmid maintenance system antidote protein VapI